MQLFHGCDRGGCPEIRIAHLVLAYRTSDSGPPNGNGTYPAGVGASWMVLCEGAAAQCWLSLVAIVV